MQILDFLRSVIHKIETTLFPERCAGGCNTYKVLLCEPCRQKMRRGDEMLAHTISAFRYDGPLREALHALKYENRQPIGELLGTLLWEEVAEELLEKHPELAHTNENFLVIPIPISSARLRERSYNQASLIAAGFSRSSNGSCTLTENVLYKIKDTESQVRVKDREKRLQNIRESFAVPNSETVRGRICIILDDVTTTGATLAEARKMLEKAGARKVVGVTLAH